MTAVEPRDLDLTEAIRAAEQSNAVFVAHTIRETVRAAIFAAAPLIAEQVRAQGRDALEQVASDRSYDSDESITEAYLDAARIVWGQS